MVGKSLPELDNLEDVLQPLLNASNSSSLQQALEILIKSSRTDDGRTELASRNILPTVLKLVESLHRASSREYLMQSMKLLRNLCAGEVVNQDSFLDDNGIDIVWTVLRNAALLSDPDIGIIRIVLQVLANVSLAGSGHKRAIWHKLIPDEFSMLAKITSQEISDPLCMILYTCCDGMPQLATELGIYPGLPLVGAIIRTVASVGFREDWFKLLLSRLCLDDLHFPALFDNLCEYNSPEIFSSDQAFLLRMISEILNEGIDEVRVPESSRVLDIFKRSISWVCFATKPKSGLPSGSTYVDVMGYSLVILRDNCARDSIRDSENRYVDDIDMLLTNEIIDFCLTLLRDLEPPAIIRKILRASENQERMGSPMLCPYRGFRRDLVAVIGNCAYRRKFIQDEIRRKNGILLLLQQCVSDDDNPFLREWGIWCLRNLLDGNAENQQVVAELQLQGSVDMAELARLNIRVEVDRNTHRAKLVNIPPRFHYLHPF